MWSVVVAYGRCVSRAAGQIWDGKCLLITKPPGVFTKRKIVQVSVV